MSYKSQCHTYWQCLHYLLLLAVPCCVASEEPHLPEQKVSERPGLAQILSDSVVFVYSAKELPDGRHEPGTVLGTAFIVGFPLPEKKDTFVPFVVTAKHVISGRQRVLIRYSQITGAEPKYVGYDLKQSRSEGDLYEHEDKGVDLVVFRTVVPKDVKLSPIPLSLIATKETFSVQHIVPLDRIAIPCLMSELPGVSRNFPILRDGTIALVSEEEIPFTLYSDENEITSNQRLIFLNSTINEGFSGAPVFLWPGMRTTSKGTTIGGTPFLIGVVHGFKRITRRVVDEDGNPVHIAKVSRESDNKKAGQAQVAEKAILSTENSAVGVAFPSWRLVEILKSDGLAKRVKQVVADGNGEKK